MDRKHQSSLTSYKETKISSATIRSGNANVQERGTFGGTSWKPKKLDLNGQTLTITAPSSTKVLRIELRDITQLERTDLADHSLGLTAKGKRYDFSFASDPELYDWQDDIYQRCPLGGYSAPFGFVHKSHIGSDNVTGTFTDPNILPIYAEIIGGQPAGKSASKSRPASGIPTAKLLGVTPLPQSTGTPTLEGVFVVKHSGLFAGWLWRERWLTLTPQMLVIHRRNNKASRPSKNIALPGVTRVEPDEKRDGCLVVEFSTRQRSASSRASASTDTLSIIFKGYSELYTWRDAIYARSGLGGPIGNPTGFVHNVHVGFDPVTGAFKGLPNEWQSANPSSSSAGASAEKKARRQSRRKSAPLEVPVAPAAA